MVVGKGAAYSQADAALRALIDATRLPFLATAMGRGVVPDRFSSTPYFPLSLFRVTPIGLLSIVCMSDTDQARVAERCSENFVFLMQPPAERQPGAVRGAGGCRRGARVWSQVCRLHDHGAVRPRVLWSQPCARTASPCSSLMLSESGAPCTDLTVDQARGQRARGTWPWQSGACQGAP